jgi:hypothetical protein
VAYFNQFLLDNDTLLTKEHMNNFPAFQQQDCTLSWWSQLENIILENKDMRTILSQFRLSLSHEAHYKVN